MRWWRPILSFGRTDLRRRGRVWIALALLLGVAAGVVLASWAGARRTSTAFPRLLTATAAFDVLANPDDGDMDFERIERLPGVAASGRIAGLVVVPPGPDGLPQFEFRMTVFGPLDPEALVTVHRPKVVRGRPPDPASPSEAVVSRDLAAESGLNVGDRIDLLAFDLDQLAVLEGLEGEEAEDLDPSLLPRGSPVTVDVVGVVLSPEEALTESVDRQRGVFVTHAFVRQYRPAAVFTGAFLHLEGGEEAIAPFVAEAQRLDGEGQVFYQTRTALTAKAERAVRPYVGALTGFALIGGVVIALVLGQALVRQITLDSSDFPALSALGMTTSQLFAGVVLRVGATAVVGALVAVPVAAALSALAPIGPVRDVEPDPGVSFDALVLGLGAAGIVLVPLALTALPAWVATRAAVRRVADRAPARPSVVAEALLHAGVSPVASTGIRMAFERGRGRTAVPVRATLIGTALSVGVLATALAFGNSLDHLVSTPRLYGGNWDVTYDLGATGGESDTDVAADLGERFVHDPDVRGVAVGGQGQVTVEGLPVPAIGVRSMKGRVDLAVVEGRSVEADGEVVLGTNTLRAIGKSVGDEIMIRVEAEARPFRVVGRGVFPLFAAYSGADKLGLGDGAAVSLDALFDLVPGAYSSFVLLDLDGDESTFERLRQEAEPFTDEVEAGFTPPQQPEDIVGYDRVDAVPYALAGLLVVLAGGTTAHALVTGLLRRQRDLAVLKTVGFDRRQIMGVVAWQASAMAVAGIAIGLPVGLGVGWWIWRWLADRIGAVPEPVVDPLPVILVVVAAVAVTNLVAAVPARRIARTSPASVLRAE